MSWPNDYRVRQIGEARPISDEDIATFFCAAGNAGENRSARTAPKRCGVYYQRV